jgi:hypothetical protein
LILKQKKKTPLPSQKSSESISHYLLHKTSFKIQIARKSSFNYRGQKKVMEKEKLALRLLFSLEFIIPHTTIHPSLILFTFLFIAIINGITIDASSNSVLAHIFAYRLHPIRLLKIPLFSIEKQNPEATVLSISPIDISLSLFLALSSFFMSIS